jgi:3-oxoacyl-[acyl-carrier protein] reductase
MNLSLKGKVAFVTGSSSGIGKAIAIGLLNEGCSIILNARNEKRLKSTATELSAPYVLGDVSDSSSSNSIIEATLNIYGKIDILVCNVGDGRSPSGIIGTEEEWLKMMRINLLSVTNIVQSSLESLKKTSGVILCISSICGEASLGASLSYSASKAALNSFIQGSAKQLAEYNVRINGLLPGNIYFEGSTWESKFKQSESQVMDMLNKKVPLKRFGKPEEIASFAVFMCSPKSEFATGSLIVIDGGQLISN